MQNVINELSAKVEQSLAAVNSSETLSAFWQEYLSKNGKVTGLMKELRNVPAAERPAAGKIINEFKQQVQAKYDEAAQKVSRAEMDARNAAETVDITMPAKIRPQGALHPITLVKNQIIDAFAGMGFQVFDAPVRGVRHEDSAREHVRARCPPPCYARKCVQLRRTARRIL